MLLFVSTEKILLLWKHTVTNMGDGFLILSDLFDKSGNRPKSNLYDFIILLMFIALSLSSVTIGSSLDKWEELNLNSERNGNRKWKMERRRSKNSSNEFLW